MYLHSRHVHPSVLKVMESQGKAVRPVHKTSKGGKIVLESVQSDGRRVSAQVSEENYFDDLFIEISPTRAFVLNESDQYELRRIDEGVMDMVRGAWNWARGLWSKFTDKLKKLLGKGRPGIEKEFMRSFEKNPKEAEKLLRDACANLGKTPEETEQIVKQGMASAAQAKAMKDGIKSQDPAYLQPMAMANDAAKRGDPQAAQKAQQALQHIHANTVNMQGGGAQGAQGEKGAKGDQGKPGQAPAQQPAAAPPAAQDQQVVQQPPAKQPAQAPPADDQSKQPSLKAGDTVEKADAQGNKIQGEVVTVDEEQAKQWNSQFGSTPGYQNIKAGLVVKTPKGFVPLDADWKAYQAQPPAAQPAAAPAQQPAQAQTPPAPAAAAPAAGGEVPLPEMPPAQAQTPPTPAAATPPAAEPAKQPETAPAEPAPPAAQPQPATPAPPAGLTQAEVGPAATPAPPVRKAPSTAAANAANADRKKYQRGFYDKQGKLHESKVRKGNLLEVFEQSDRPLRRLGKGKK